MSKLALSDDILMAVEKPARYIGNEVNSVMKDKELIECINAFFKNIASAFLLAFFAYGVGKLGMIPNADSSVIGARK